MLIQVETLDGKKAAFNVMSVEVVLLEGDTTTIKLNGGATIETKAEFSRIVKDIARSQSLDLDCIHALVDLVQAADHLYLSAEQRDEVGPPSYSDEYESCPEYKGTKLFHDYYDLRVATEYLSDRLQIPLQIANENDGDNDSDDL